MLSNGGIGAIHYLGINRSLQTLVRCVLVFANRRFDTFVMNLLAHKVDIIHYKVYNKQ